MAKIILPSFDELILPEANAKLIYCALQDAKQVDLPLNAQPITVNHNDGLWIGNMADLDKSKFMLEEKITARAHTFKSNEDLQRFHQEYGYGEFSDYYLSGYGIVNVQTQFLIKTNQAKIIDNKLVMLNNPHKDKWGDLWAEYQSKLDPFNELDYYLHGKKHITKILYN